MQFEGFISKHCNADNKEDNNKNMRQLDTKLNKIALIAWSRMNHKNVYPVNANLFQ